MDIRMPKLSGLAATEQIRLLPAGRTVKIVAVSASVFSSDREEAVVRGCDDFLPKPFREAELLGVIGRLLQLDWIDAAAPAVPPAEAPADPAARPAPRRTGGPRPAGRRRQRDRPAHALRPRSASASRPAARGSTALTPSPPSSK